MKVAVEGCSHGELDKIYEVIEHVAQSGGFKLDLLICCGDFQAVRNKSDLECMAVPPKYRLMNSFYKYYSGEKVAPVLTLFIGGNHEASNYLAELAYGGWVCPNIYYMGYAGCVQFGGLRIAGLSGIYKGPDYLKGHFETLPYTESTKRSAYHIRNIDVFRLKQLSSPLDIVLSHDWPRGVYNHGDKEQLLRFKPFFREEMETNKLGSRPAEELLHQLKPEFWFAAHLHVKYAAIVRHEKTETAEECTTKFLALDKCLPRRRFLQILDIPSKGDQPLALHYDPEWLCILKSTNHLLCVTRATSYMPGPGCGERHDFTPTSEELQHVQELFKGDFRIPLSFSQTVPPYDPVNRVAMGGPSSPQSQLNPQTTALCTLLGIHDPVALLNKDGFSTPPAHSTPNRYAPGACEADITLVDSGINASQVSLNPDEISLSDIDDNDDDDDDDDDNDINGEDDDVIPSLPIAALFAEKDETPSPSFSFPEYKLPDKKEGIHPLDEEEEKKDESSSSGTVAVKKFKRRNASLYESKDDSDEG